MEKGLKTASRDLDPDHFLPPNQWSQWSHPGASSAASRHWPKTLELLVQAEPPDRPNRSPDGIEDARVARGRQHGGFLYQSGHPNIPFLCLAWWMRGARPVDTIGRADMIVATT